jgi:hypothetical protein
MLGEQGQPGGLDRRGDAPVHLAQPHDRREQAEAAAAGRQEQAAIGGRDLVHVVPPQVVDDQDARLPRVVEGRRHAGADRRHG